MVKIQIPATSANLGSGFDALGVALNLYNYVYLRESDEVKIVNRDSMKVPENSNNLIYKTAKYLYETCGKTLPGLYIEQTNNIPIARGLGSSSACIVAGLLGANQLMGCPLSRKDIVNFAANLEGHPDNSSPALMGGLVTSVIEDGQVYCVKQEIKDDLCFAAFIPDFELKTSSARGVIPKEVRHRDAVFNLSRASLMSVSLHSGNYENLRVACRDHLHQPFRMSLIHGAQEIFELSYRLDAYATYISGAGSTIMAIVDKKNTSFATLARQEMDQLGFQNWSLKMLSIDNVGAVLEEDSSLV